MIQIHGRGTDRTECLRAVPAVPRPRHHLTAGLVPQRRRGPRSRAGTYALGATGVAGCRGGPRIRPPPRRAARHPDGLVDGRRGRAADRARPRTRTSSPPSSSSRPSSTGGSCSTSRPSSCASRTPSPSSQSPRWDRPGAAASPGRESAIPFDRLDVVARANELTQPILILHSDDDGFVPSDASHELAVARPDLVTLQVFDTARHTKLWNYDQERWTNAITDWLTQRGLTSPAS